MHAIWSGVVGFGLVNIPVRLYSHSKEEELDIDLLHKKDRSPVRYARVCKEEEKEIAWEDIVKGFKTKKGYVILTDEDFAKADARKTRAIDIIHFSKPGGIDPIFFDKPYYLEPEKGAGKAYALLREALRETGMVGVATFVLRHRERLAVVRPYKNALVLDQIRYPREIIGTDALSIPAAAVTRKEMKIAVDLIKSSTEIFKPKRYRDEYLKALRAIIREKSRGIRPKKRGQEPKPTEAADIISELMKSLSQGRRKAAAR